MSALPAEADKPRVVVDYSGILIVDARENIRIVIPGIPPRGMCWCLRDAGFKYVNDGVWQSPASPRAIFDAQNLIATFFPNRK